MHQTWSEIKINSTGQTAEVFRRQLKSREAGASADDAVKLQIAESRLSELKNALSALGREATVAMTSVESQQQEVTFQRLLTMVCLFILFMLHSRKEKMKFESFLISYVVFYFVPFS